MASPSLKTEQRFPVINVTVSVDMYKVDAQPDGEFIRLTPATADFKPKKKDPEYGLVRRNIGLNFCQIRAGANVSLCLNSRSLRDSFSLIPDVTLTCTRTHLFSSGETFTCRSWQWKEAYIVPNTWSSIVSRFTELSLLLPHHPTFKADGRFTWLQLISEWHIRPGVNQEVFRSCLAVHPSRRSPLRLNWACHT